MMRKNGWGRIINMTSIYGVRGTPNRIDYVASKSAIAGMTRGIAARLIHDNITCNALRPGSVLNPNIDSRINMLMQQKNLTRAEAKSEFLKGKQPGGKIIPAEYVARQALYLCEESARFINGSVLPVEDGWLSRLESLKGFHFLLRVSRLRRREFFTHRRSVAFPSLLTRRFYNLARHKTPMLLYWCPELEGSISGNRPLAKDFPHIASTALHNRDVDTRVKPLDNSPIHDDLHNQTWH